MSEQPGGYRPPVNPAPVSGPGALSRRTDGAQPRMPLPNAGYGEQAEFQAIQAGAPMMQEGAAVPPPPSLMDPTMAPDEPVTAGAALGPGPGMEALSASDAAARELQQISKYLPMMERMAGRVDAPRSFRALVQFIKAYQ